jgi:deoxyribodipyrimidine photolyase
MADMKNGATSRPDPDPTLLTTQQMLREVEELKDLVFTRLDAMDKAVILVTGNTAVTTGLQISHLKELFAEKFETISLQFKERDVRTEQMATQTKVAVDAALQAAEKAVGKQNEAFQTATAKSELSVTKQIDQLGTLFQNSTRALEEKINELRDRFNRGEGVGAGRDNEHTSRLQSVAMGNSTIVAICAVAALIGGLIAHFMK